MGIPSPSAGFAQRSSQTVQITTRVNGNGPFARVIIPPGQLPTGTFTPELVSRFHKGEFNSSQQVLEVANQTFNGRFSLTEVGEGFSPGLQLISPQDFTPTSQLPFKDKIVGVLQGGGPTPGGSVVEDTIFRLCFNLGAKEVLEFQEGAEGLHRWNVTSWDRESASGTDLWMEPCFPGGSSRTNPCDFKHLMDTIVENVINNRLDILVLDGGDDTGKFGAALKKALFAKNYKGIDIISIPKTLDNDFPLQVDFNTMIPTHGYDTVLNNILERLVAVRAAVSRGTFKHYFLARLFGRSSGWLATPLALALRPQLAFIPEQLAPIRETYGIEAIIDEALGVINRRIQEKVFHGLAIIPDGLYDFMEGWVAQRFNMEKVFKDPHGHPVLSMIPFEKLLAEELQKRIDAQYPLKTVLEKINDEAMLLPEFLSQFPNLNPAIWYRTTTGYSVDDIHQISFRTQRYSNSSRHWSPSDYDVELTTNFTASALLAVACGFGKNLDTPVVGSGHLVSSDQMVGGTLDMGQLLTKGFVAKRNVPAFMYQPVTDGLSQWAMNTDSLTFRKGKLIWRPKNGTKGTNTKEVVHWNTIYHPPASHKWEFLSELMNRDWE